MAFSCAPKATVLSQSDVETALIKAGGTQQIEIQTKNLFSTVKYDDFTSLDASDLTNFPALTRFASQLNGRILGIWGDPSACLRIRFGNHQHYQFVYIFKSEAVVHPTEGMLHITNNIYFKP